MDVCSEDSTPSSCLEELKRKKPRKTAKPKRKITKKYKSPPVSSAPTSSSSRDSSNKETGGHLPLHQQLQLFRESQLMVQAARQSIGQDKARVQHSLGKSSHYNQESQATNPWMEEQHFRNKQRLEDWKMELARGFRNRESGAFFQDQSSPSVPSIAKFVYFGENHPILYCSQLLSQGSCTTRYLVPKSEIWPRNIVGDASHEPEDASLLGMIDLCKGERTEARPARIPVIVNERTAPSRNYVYHEYQGRQEHQEMIPTSLPANQYTERVHNTSRNEEGFFQERSFPTIGNVRHFPVTLESRNQNPNKKMTDSGSQTDWSLQPSEPFLFIATNQCDLKDGEEEEEEDGPAREGSETETDDGETEIQISLASNVNPQDLLPGGRQRLNRAQNNCVKAGGSVRNRPKRREKDCAAAGQSRCTASPIPYQVNGMTDHHSNNLDELGNFGISGEDGQIRQRIEEDSAQVESTVNRIVADLLNDNEESHARKKFKESKQFDFDLFQTKPTSESYLDLYQQISGRDPSFRKSCASASRKCADPSLQLHMSLSDGVGEPKARPGPAVRQADRLYEDADLEQTPEEELFPTFDSLLQENEPNRSKADFPDLDRDDSNQFADEVGFLSDCEDAHKPSGSLSRSSTLSHEALSNDSYLGQVGNTHPVNLFQTTLY